MTPFTGGEVNAYFEYSKGGLLGKLIFVLGIIARKGETSSGED